MIDLIAEHLACASMSGKAALWLERNGVPAASRHTTAAGWISLILCADVTFGRSRFECARHRPSEDAVSAFVFPVYNRWGDNTDLAAWRPPADVGVWVGNCCMFGEEQLDPALRDGPLVVHADVLSWLRACRHGVVVIDERRAVPLLREVGPLVVDDIDFGERLKRTLTLKAPRILVRAAPVEEAA